MRMQRGTRHSAIQDPLQIAAEIPDRALLEDMPGSAVVAAFVMTRGAGRAWAAINQSLSDPRGAIFWIAGPPGSGKTHFLNYVTALSQRAGTVDPALARNLTIALDTE